MKYTCLNPIASVGLDQFTEGYEKTEKMEEELIYKEYDMLHQEIEQKISLQNNLLIFMITTTVTIITLAIKSDSLSIISFSTVISS